MGAAAAEGVPTEAEIRRAGFAPEDYEDDYLECWPENWPAYQVFASIQNQWRVGVSGPIALDYSVLFARMERLHLSDDDFEQLFEDVRALEVGALAYLNRPKDTDYHD